MSTFEGIQISIASSLDGINRYNPENIKLLESYVNAQCTENRYDLEANLTLLKLYQLNVERYKPDIVAKILLKCMMQLPKTDIVLAKCLIDQARINQEGPVNDTLEIHQKLENCFFASVWSNLAKNSEIPTVVGFENAVRLFVCHVVNITYQNIDRSLLHQLLGEITEKDLQAYCNQFKWQLKEDGYVYISSQEATIKSRNIAEKVEFNFIQDILRSVA